MDDFLASIPAVQRLLQSEDETQRPQRGVVFRAIRSALERELARERETLEVRVQAGDRLSDSRAPTDPETDDGEWLKQLAELDLGDTDDGDCDDNGVAYPNTIDSMAWFLTRYAVSRPWIPMSMHNEQLRDMDRDSSIASVGEDSSSSPAPVQTDIVNKSIMDCDDLESLPLLLTVPDLKSGGTGMACVNLNEETSTTSRIMDIIADSDRRLGLAGFLPFVEQPKGDGEESNRQNWRQNDELNDDLLLQWRSHTRLAADCARVCFVSYKESVTTISSFASLFSCTERSLKALLSQISILGQIKGHPIKRIHFIRLRPAPGEVPLESLDRQAEIGEMEVTSIEDLATAVELAKTALAPSPIRGIGIYNLAFDTGFWALDYLLTRSAVYLAPEVRAYTNDTHLRLFLQVLDTSQAVLERLGVSVPNREEMEMAQKPAYVMLHFMALAVQGLTLILQFYLRGLATPGRFQFLTHTVASFVLEGTNHQPTSQKLYASSQRLSCLGDMLEKEVLVFGMKESDPHHRFDIVATPAQLAELWGPVQLMISRPSTADKMSIVGIRIHRGLLIPTTEKSPRGMPKWHWVADDSADAHIPITDTFTGVDIHTQICIGAKDYLKFHPIGPARLNETCPRHGSDSFIPEYILAQSLRSLGTRNPSLECQSFTGGIQGGQGAIMTAQGTWARKPGVTVKYQLLNSVRPFKARMAELDQMWGLAVSLCTGVMTRVRLRELVAFYCLKCSSTTVPGIEGLADRNHSLDGFAQAMFGDDSLCNWFESLIPPSTDNLYDRVTLEQHISRLFREVLMMLEATGIQENGDLAVACISRRHSVSEARLLASKVPWVKVLKDSSSTATFACLLPCCFETDHCVCQKANWQLAGMHQLATKLDLFVETFNGFQGGHKPLVGKLYRINSADINVMTRIHHRMKLPDGSFLYYATIKNSALRSVIHEYVPRRPRLRENDSASAFKVIIGGGSDYLQHLEYLQRQGSTQK
ncbi:hypothetical protein BJY04DRAFT_221281 [Aspergillus karnatakaensis]|uniref:uncharacterized protein n=1 Tax=Aspergillus karnatakaensis TaxID=1810916 RepID=UPI003CCDCC5A